MDYNRNLNVYCTPARSFLTQFFLESLLKWFFLCLVLGCTFGWFRDKSFPSFVYYKLSDYFSWKECTSFVSFRSAVFLCNGTSFPCLITSRMELKRDVPAGSIFTVYHHETRTSKSNLSNLKTRHYPDTQKKMGNRLSTFKAAHFLGETTFSREGMQTDRSRGNFEFLSQESI